MSTECLTIKNFGPIKKAETKEVQHMTLEGMEKELRENTKHQMEYVNSLKQNTMNSRA